MSPNGLQVVHLAPDQWELDERQVLKGNRLKYTVSALPGNSQPPLGIRRWIWKTSKPSYPLEFWSEIVAAEVGAVIGLPVPRALPARTGEGYGALMEFMTAEGGAEGLVHGGDLILAVKPDYDRTKGRDHSIQLIDQVLDRVQLPRLRNALLQQFFFDALIGNQDRHQDNWGVIVRLRESEADSLPVFRLAPAFDNGSSLGRELDEARIARMLADPESLIKYIRRGQAHVRWDDAGTLLELSHEDLLRRMLSAWPEVKALAIGFYDLPPKM